MLLKDLVKGQYYQAVRKLPDSPKCEWKAYIFRYNGGTLHYHESHINPETWYTDSSGYINALSNSGILDPARNSGFVDIVHATQEQIEYYLDKMREMGKLKEIAYEPDYSHFNFMP